jgi:NADH-quinone oxidoreductase subunit C
MAMEDKKILGELQKKFPGKILEVSEALGDEVAAVEKDALLNIVKYLKNKPYEYSMLLDLTCVDYPGRAERFEMVYHLFSFAQNRRFRIKVRLPEKEPAVDSLTSLWSNANWLEREVYDMFGVHFHGHPDLRRIFMYDGFEGFPLRKDYPLRKRQPLIPLRK